MNEALEDTARRIAEQGRDALIARLRPAFEQAASAHADVLELSAEQIEQMVQRAADRADGLQWRRTLAAVASEQLGIGLGEALAHPAVERAQAIVGASSYEESVQELGGPFEQARNGEHGGPDEPADIATPAGAAVPAGSAPPADPAEASDEPESESATDPLRIAAVHLGGIANLAPEEGGLELRLSDAGLEISRGETEALGRLTWREIRAVEVAAPGGIRRRRRRNARLVVRTRQGEASFQIPALSPDELRKHLAPVLDRHQKR